MAVRNKRSLPRTCERKAPLITCSLKLPWLGAHPTNLMTQALTLEGAEVQVREAVVQEAGTAAAAAAAVLLHLPHLLLLLS